MTKATVAEWSTTAANNTVIGGISIAEGMNAAALNNAMREQMAQIAAWRDSMTGTALIATGGSTAVSLANHAAKVLTPEDFGAVGDGVTNDRAAFVAADTYLAANGGGVIQLSSSGRYLIDSAFSLSDRVSIAGPPANHGQWSGNYNDWGAALVLNPAGALTLNDSCTLENLIIINKNTPDNVAQTTKAAYLAAATAMLATFTGTAVTVSGADASIRNVAILGFATAVDGNSCHRLYMDNVRIDCTNGVDLDDTLDVVRLYDVHLFPYLTAGWGQSDGAIDNDQRAKWERSGAAFNLTGVNDGITMLSCFSFCWDKGVVANATATPTLMGHWADYFPELERTTTIGYEFNNAARGAQLIGCRCSSYGVGLEIDTDDTVILEGWHSWACQVTHINHVNGWLTSAGQRLDLFSKPNTVKGYVAGAGVDGATISGPIFSGFTTSVDIDSGVASSVTFLGPQYDGASGGIGTTVPQLDLSAGGDGLTIGGVAVVDGFQSVADLAGGASLADVINKVNELLGAMRDNNKWPS